MILLLGSDPSVVAALERALAEAKLEFRRIAAEDAEPAALFTAAFEARADTIVGTDALPRLGQGAPEGAPSPALLDHARAAAHAPGVRRLIWVRSPETGAAVARVRADGVPYTFVDAAPVAELVVEVERGVAGQAVMLPASTAEPEIEATTAGWIAAQVVRVLGDPESVGRAEAAGRPAPGLYAQLLVEAGATPRPAAAWRGKLGGWFGATRLVADPRGARVVRGRARAQDPAQGNAGAPSHGARHPHAPGHGAGDAQDGEDAPTGEPALQRPAAPARARRPAADHLNLA